MNRVKIVLWLNGESCHFCYIDYKVYKKALNRALNVTKKLKMTAKKEFGLIVETKEDLETLFFKISSKYYSESTNPSLDEIIDTYNKYKADKYCVKENWLTKILGGRS